MIGTSIALSFGKHRHVQSSTTRATETVKKVLVGNETQRQGKILALLSVWKEAFVSKGYLTETQYGQDSKGLYLEGVTATNKS